jgi:hypothetical protein
MNYLSVKIRSHKKSPAREAGLNGLAPSAGRVTSTVPGGVNRG